MNKDTMTTADAQAMIEEVLEAERTGNPIEESEESQQDELIEADEIDLYELYADQQKLVNELKRFGYKPKMAWRGGIGTIVEFKAPPANVGRMDAAAMRKIIGAKTFRWFEARNDGEVAIGM